MNNDIPVGVDSTDHIAFFCPLCSRPLQVVGVQTQRLLVNENTNAHDKCTWIRLRCTCGFAGQRKFYWTTEDGQYCDKRTDAADCQQPNTP